MLIFNEQNRVIVGMYAYRIGISDIQMTHVRVREQRFCFLHQQQRTCFTGLTKCSITFHIFIFCWAAFVIMMFSYMRRVFDIDFAPHVSPHVIPMQCIQSKKSMYDLRLPPLSPTPLFASVLDVEISATELETSLGICSVSVLDFIAESSLRWA